MPSLWLALVLFQLAVAVPTPRDAHHDVSIKPRDLQPNLQSLIRKPVLYRDDNESDESYWWRGTNANAKYLGHAGPDRRVATNYQAALKDPSAQPELPVGGRCKYAYEHSAADFSVFDAEANAPVTDKDVAQGAIGDCGLGSSVAAVAVTGHAHYLRDRLEIKEDGSYEFQLSLNGTQTKVVIDDQLPRVTADSDRRCREYLSFQVTGEDNRTAYVPLVEKAIAKYLDANPAAKSINDTKGYLTLSAIWPDVALELLTGAKRQRVFREVPGLDPGINTALARCLTQNEPCVVGTPPVFAETWRWFTDAAHANDTEWAIPYGANFTSADLTANTTADSFHVVDHDTGNKDTVNTVVPSHAWAIDKNRSTWDPNDIRGSRIRILNPWGENLKPWTALDAPNALELSFPAFASIIDAVFTVESLP